MIYRVTGCNYYDSTEPDTTCWLTASSPNEASARLRALLALTWELDDPDRIFWDGPRKVFDLEHDSLQPSDAGYRRWVEAGSTVFWEPDGTQVPAYFYDLSPANMLLFLDANDRRLVRQAMAEGLSHCESQANDVAARIMRLKHAGAEERVIKSFETMLEELQRNIAKKDQ